MKTLYKISTCLVLALGILPICLTPRFFSSLTQTVLWFVSGGLVMVFVSFFNFILLKDVSRDRTIGLLCHSANILGLIFAAAMFGLDALRARPSSASWVVLCLFIFVPVAAFRYRSS